jgi:hypothetical protein
MRRFKVKLRDESGIEIGVVLAELIVVAESAAEAELYVSQALILDAPMWPESGPWHMTTEEIPTAD